MARLTHPTAGTVIHVDDAGAEKYEKAGWVADKPAREPRKSSK